MIFDPAGSVFVPRHTPATRLPGLWDVVGGHVEPGESIVAALRREVFEETGWTVTGEPEIFYVCEWEFPEEPGRRRREFDFVVTVDGDLERPALAPAEHTDFLWVGFEDLDRLDENRNADQGLVRRIVGARSRGNPPAHCGRRTRPCSSIQSHPTPRRRAGDGIR